MEEAMDNNYEYNSLVRDILDNKCFQKLEYYPHHNTNRLEHSKRVSYLSYKICKALGLDFVCATRGALLHDFFLDSYDNNGKANLLVNHPSIALQNAKKYFEINAKEANIIESHMFPVNMKKLPRYAESFVITITDKMAFVYEKTKGYKEIASFKLGVLLIYLVLILSS